MIVTLWFAVVGALLIVMALASTVLKRLPLTVTMLYLALGYALGPAGLSMHRLYPLESSALLERISEIIVIVSLFTAGLKLRLPLRERAWRVPIRLAFLSMMVTVGLITATGYWLMGLPLGAAVLLGAILAPTDPVLASDVQVQHERDEEPLRFGLTGEAGLNDGTAFPFVMLGLGLVGAHDLGPFGGRWLGVDVIWAILGGLAIGWLLGAGTAKLVLYLRREHKEALGTDDFLALGLIGLAYGAALLAHTYGFLAVFAAGLALRSVERQSKHETPPDEDVEIVAKEEMKEGAAADPDQAPQYMASAVLSFNEQLERIGVVGVLILVGGMIYPVLIGIEALWFVPVLFLVIRPLSVWIGLAGAGVPRVRRAYMSWFGIRGIGSIYYLMYAIENGMPGEISARLVNLTFIVVAVSVVVHGVSVTPLMNYYQRLTKGGQGEGVE
jgi:sodium/hydrogen antiporter